MNPQVGCSIWKIHTELVNLYLNMKLIAFCSFKDCRTPPLESNHTSMGMLFFAARSCTHTRPRAANQSIKSNTVYLTGNQRKYLYVRNGSLWTASSISCRMAAATRAQRAAQRGMSHRIATSWSAGIHAKFGCIAQTEAT